jgi:hypothetical protein
MSIIRTALVAGACIGALSVGVAIGQAHRGSDPAPMRSVAVAAAQPQDEAAPALSLGGTDPIVPLVCGVNLDCSDVDRMRAEQAKPKVKKSASSSTRTVRTSHSSTGASSTTVTQRTATGSDTVRTSRTAKGVTTVTHSHTSTGR